MNKPFEESANCRYGAPMGMIDAQQLKSLSISSIARLIKQDWAKVYFGAVPYLEAMLTLNSVNDNYGEDDGKSIVIYFLSNASTYRGETAKIIKAELKQRIK